MEANYILKANEAVSMRANNSKTFFYIKRALWIIIAILIIGSLVFGENMFIQLDWGTRVVFIMFMVYFLAINNKKHRVASPFEIRFYDDYLVVYREKRYYNPIVSRMQFDKFYYNDIESCEFRTETKLVNIYGILEAIWYDYNKDGTLPQKPTYHKTTEGVSCFYTSHSDVDFVHEIEAHSPIKVIIKNS